MTIKPENCATCGKPTRSHNLAIDISDVDEVGLPTLAGVVCHTCWTGGTDGVSAIEDIIDDHGALYDEVSIDRMVTTEIEVEQLLS